MTSVERLQWGAVEKADRSRFSLVRALTLLLAVAFVASACSGEASTASAEPELPLTLVDEGITDGVEFETTNDLAQGVCADGEWPSNLLATATGPQQILAFEQSRSELYTNYGAIEYPYTAYEGAPLAADFVVCVTMTDEDSGLGGGYCSSDQGSHQMVANMYSVVVLDLQDQTLIDHGLINPQELCPGTTIFFFETDDGSPTFFYSKPSFDEFNEVMAEYKVERNNPSTDSITLDEAIQGLG